MYRINLKLTKDADERLTVLAEYLNDTSKTQAIIHAIAITESLIRIHKDRGFEVCLLDSNGQIHPFPLLDVIAKKLT